MYILIFKLLYIFIITLINYFTNKNKFDKENNTVYGLPVEIVPFTLKPYNQEPIQTKAVKIGYIYIVETKDRCKNWTGMSCEEIVEAIFNNKETQKCFDALGLYFGLGVEGPYCSPRNIVKFYKDFPSHWCC